MNLVNRQRAGSGDGTNCYDTASSWILDLDFVPTPGNTLILYLGLPNGINIDLLLCGGVGVDSAYFGGVSNAGVAVSIFTVPETPPTNFEILFGTGGHQFSSIVEEVHGISSHTPDQVNHASGSGPAYNSGFTSTTTQRVEYWSNIYAYYNASVGSDPLGSAPSNGYALYSTNPVKHYETGWHWAFPNPTSSPPTISAGVLLGSKFVIEPGVAGGSVTDADSNVNTYYGAALAFFGPRTSPSVQINTNPPSGGLIRFPALRQR